jgi:hypothetical protein
VGAARLSGVLKGRITFAWEEAEASAFTSSATRPGYGLSGRRKLIMDKPLTPSEELADAITSLTLSLEQLRDALEVLACEIIVAPREVRRPGRE